MVNNELSHQEQVNISQYIATIYQQARQMEINEFRYYCLDTLNDIITFDGALWFDRRDHDFAFTGLDTFLYKLPNNFMENYNEYISKEHLDEEPAGKYCLENPNVTFTLWDVFKSRDEFYQSDAYIHHCQKFNLTDLLSTLYVSTFSKKNQLIALYKFNKDILSSNKDKTIKSILDPHFAEAMTMNILANFDRQCSSKDAYRAIADIHGNILEAEDSFVNKLEVYKNLNTEKITIPKLSNGNIVKHNLPNGIEIKLQLKDTLVLIELPKEMNFSSLLTPKKIEICDLIKEGLPDKSIAIKLNISTYTVSNHLKNIYKRLGSKNRLGTLAYLTN